MSAVGAARRVSAAFARALPPRGVLRPGRTAGLPDELREATSTPRRYGWASLLAPVFAVDVTVCSKCGGKMRILEVVTDPEALAELLHGARVPPRPCPPGQLGLFG